MLKDEILKALYKNRMMHSGEALAEAFGVSRNAVWKCIKQLQSEGFAIAASTNKGYFLESCGTALSPVLIEQELQGCSLGKPLYFFPRIDSTNTKAKALAEAGAPTGTLVVSEEQTAGKGRLGRNFYSPGRQGVYFSVLLRPEHFGDHAMLITSLCAAATAEAIEKVAPVQVAIKWVNDLFVRGKKICGILTEAGIKLEDQSMDYVIAGIGINCAKQRFPGELEQIATSIENECGVTVNRNRLVAEVIKNIEAGLKSIESKSFLSVCRQRSNVIGKPITVCRGERQYPAIALGIDNNGGLQIRDENGNLETLQSGEVRIRI